MAWKSPEPPEDVNDLIEMGEFYFLNQKLHEAERVLKRALRLAPRNIKACYTLGVVYEAMNEADKAKALYEKVLHLDPDNKAAREHLDRLIGV